MQLIKFIRMFIVSLFTAVVLYPVIHESGHSIAVIMLGGKCLEFNLFPLPSVLCDASGMNNISLIITGLAGLLLPFLLCLIFRGNSFSLWYMSVIFKGITALSMLISFAVTVMNMAGHGVANDDITKVLELWQGGGGILLCGEAAAAAVIVLLIVKDKPLQRLQSEFDAGLPSGTKNTSPQLVILHTRNLHE